MLRRRLGHLEIPELRRPHDSLRGELQGDGRYLIGTALY